MSEDSNVLIDGQEISLADLAGIDLTEVAEYRLTSCPAGKFHWRIMDTKMESREVVKDFDNPDDGKINVAYIIVDLQAQNCYAVTDDKLSPDQFVDQKHTLKFKLADVQKGLGKYVAFLVDIGLEGNKSVKELMDESHGMEFDSDVAVKPNPNNPDYMFVNLNNIKPFVAGEHEVEGGSTEAT